MGAGTGRPRILCAAATPSCAAAVVVARARHVAREMEVGDRSGRQELSRRLDADPDEHGVDANVGAVVEADRLDPAPCVGVEARDGGAEPDVAAVCAPASGEHQPDLLAEHACERRGGCLDDRDSDAQRARRRSDLGADEARADDREACAGSEHVAQPARVGERA